MVALEDRSELKTIDIVLNMDHNNNAIDYLLDDSNSQLSDTMVEKNPSMNDESTTQLMADSDTTTATVDVRQQEERRRRNRESAARSRERLRDKIICGQRGVAELEERRSALKNELRLVLEEARRLRRELDKHQTVCGYVSPHMTPPAFGR